MELNKQHNTAETSRESYREAIRSGLIQKEKHVVLAHIKQHQPITARQVSYGCGIEKSNITRCLYDLVKAEHVKVSFVEKCPITERRVGYYTLIDWVAEPEHQQAA
jgi:DNA-binding MarR family transcriptional regulator